MDESENLLIEKKKAEDFIASFDRSIFYFDKDLKEASEAYKAVYTTEKDKYSDLMRTIIGFGFMSYAKRINESIGALLVEKMYYQAKLKDVIEKLAALEIKHE